MSTRRTEFFDGFSSETTPNTVPVAGSGLIGEWQGTWVSQNYVENDVVEFNGSSYICILDTVSNEDPSNPTYWELVAEKGDDGADGEAAAGIAKREIPAGAIDGINVVYNLSQAPTSDDHVSVYIDGVFLENSEYVISSAQITLNDAPQLGQTIFVQYYYGGTPFVAPGTEIIEYHTVTAGEESAKQFTMGNTPSTAGLTLVDIIGGTSQEFGVDFTVTGSTFNWSGFGLDGDLLENDVVRLKYFV